MLQLVGVDDEVEAEMAEVPTHELHTFLKQDLDEMRSEYERIRGRSVEDPGTAGDEGEEAWAAVLRSWLPDSYVVRTKGRVLAASGAAGPQVDIVVLRPGYPRRLLDKKLYLAGGVAAVFECKNTLTAAGIEKTWGNVRKVNELEGEIGIRSPMSDLVPSIFYGLLAHGHAWNKPKSEPLNLLIDKMNTLVDDTPRMRDFLSLICVANLGSFDIMRFTYDGPGIYPAELWEARKGLRGASSDDPLCSVSYYMASESVTTYEASNPLGVLVSKIVGRLAFSDATLRPLSQYFYASGLAGQMGVPVIHRNYILPAQMSEEAIAGLPHSLTNGVAGSDWSMAFQF